MKDFYEQKLNDLKNKLPTLVLSGQIIGIVVFWGKDPIVNFCIRNVNLDHE